MSSSDQITTEPITLDEARELIASGAAVLVDVREQHEWDAGHAPEAVHMPIGELDAAALPPDVQTVPLAVPAVGERERPWRCVRRDWQRGT